MLRGLGRWWNGLSPLGKGAVVAGSALGTAALVAPVAAGAMTAGGAGATGLLANRWPVAPGYAFTLWTGGTAAQAWAALRTPFAAIRPQAIIPHSGYGGARADLAPVLAEARRLSPGLRVWGQVAAAPGDAAQSVVDTGLRYVEMHGAELVSWNAEAAFRGGDQAAATRGARAIVEGFARRYPNVPQVMTSYPRPTEIRSFPWEAFFGGRGHAGNFTAAGLPHCRGFIPQVYAIEDNRTTTLDASVVPRSFDRMIASVTDAVRSGVLRADVAIGVYLASRYIPEADLVAVGSRCQAVSQWPWRGAYDPAGLTAATQLANRWR